MEQLLSITSVPIAVEITVNRAHLDYNTELPKVDVSRNKGGFKIQADPIRIDIDSTAVYNSIGLKNIDTLRQDYSQESIKVCYQATASIVQEGDLLLGQNITPAQIAAQKSQRSIETILSFLPTEGPDISWTGGTLSINYQTDDLNFDWETTTRAAFEFVPGSIEFNIKSMPKVDIEYIGEPIYCPPSANPNYVESELDVKA